ncbi:response regulator [Leptospira gomenensis]|uniref:Response regulator n=1 Tax=Leptospira gomenensis TaxID=2484974 RepID=A0A5F1YIA3_9LEPT|nr:response regulator [Leptospira gomenensis]TGK39256.1 response regulator [Leptospira gomenensis]TGK43998.1 response regulator [Leptospira gomenensis]TGK48926.1 response regulator [Leptospira gomenensis]TGK54636.1 response regulator [Leptospira gomenensis]
MKHDAILCVDDEPIILIALKQELKKQFGNEFQYETAVNAKEAMEAVDELAVSGVKVILILSDWRMPGIKGDEFLIQVHRKYPEIRSILITGHVDEDAVERVKKEAGTYAVLPKPWDPKQLMDAVRVCCAKS